MHPSNPQEPEGISIATELSLTVGETFTLSPTVIPEDAVDKSVTFASATPTVANVTPKLGKVTAIAKGTAVITVTTSNGITKDITVTVSEQVTGGGLV